MVAPIPGPPGDGPLHHPLGKTRAEIEVWVLELLGEPEDVGYYARNLRMYQNPEGQLVVQAHWLGFLEDVEIDPEAQEPITHTREWVL